MAVNRHSTRQDDALASRLLGAFVVSLLAHLSFFGVVRLGDTLKWWDARPFRLFQSVKVTPEDLERIREQQRKIEQKREHQQPVMFIQVTQPSEEPPPESKFYSSVSARAANPEPGREREAKIDGTQDQLARLADAPRLATGRSTPPPRESPGTADPSPEGASAAVPVEVASPTPRPEPEPVREPAPMPKLVEQQPTPPRPPGLGELAMVRPEVRRPEIPEPVERPREPQPQPVVTPPAVSNPTPTPAPAPKEARARPRTVTEAKLRQELLAGQKMRQEGGVERKGPVQIDAVGLPFGAYDEAMVGAVQSRWFALLDERRYVGGVAGRVVVRFRLYSDGSVRSCEASESGVDPLFTELCVRAVSDPAPYEKWPSDMLRMIGSNVREMRFTFLYN